MRQPECDRIKRNIQNIISRAGRINKKATIVAVSKTFSIEHIECAVEEGLIHFGESKVQEAARKINIISRKNNNLKWHLIGHLQSNKTNKALDLFDMLDTVDRPEIAGKIGAASLKKEKTAEVLIQIKVSDEEAKFGIPADRAPEEAGRIAGIRGVKVRGIMAMAPYFEDGKNAAPYFKKARKVFENIKRQLASEHFSTYSSG